jgi:hypothetical protein
VSLEINALFRKYAENLANLDLQGNNAEQAYGSNVRNISLNRDADLKKLSENMAGRGLTHSGINLQNNVSLNKTYDEGRNRADQEQRRIFTEIAKKKLAAQQDYDTARAYDSFSGLTGIPT